MEENGQNEEIKNNVQSEEQNKQEPVNTPENTDKPAAGKDKIEEFSVKWHLKVLAVIYVVLGIFYIILKLTLD